jgi:hypothetical protein
MLRTLASVLTSAAWTAVLLAVLAVTLNEPQTTPGHATLPTLPPCATEDAYAGPVPCLWDAATRGNGIGRSFVLTPDH